mgnify:CR=1 FL=1
MPNTLKKTFFKNRSRKFKKGGSLTITESTPNNNLETQINSNLMVHLVIILFVAPLICPDKI